MPALLPSSSTAPFAAVLTWGGEWWRRGTPPAPAAARMSITPKSRPLLLEHTHRSPRRQHHKRYNCTRAKRTDRGLALGLAAQPRRRRQLVRHHRGNVDELGHTRLLARLPVHRVPGVFRSVLRESNQLTEESGDLCVPIIPLQYVIRKEMAGRNPCTGNKQTLAMLLTASTFDPYKSKNRVCSCLPTRLMTTSDRRTA